MSRPSSRKARAARTSRAARRSAPSVPPFAVALSGVPALTPPRFTLQDAARMEERFGWVFPHEARLLMVGLQDAALEGGAAEVLTLAQMEQLNLLTPDAPRDATSWTATRLGLFCVARDAQDNRLLMDVADPSGACPIWLCTTGLGLAASALPCFPRATDLLTCFALYTRGKDARDAASEVERLEAALAELRKQRPNVFKGRDDALAKLAAAFGPGAGAPAPAPAGSGGVSPTAEDEGRLGAALEGARDRHRQLWMPFMEQFSRWTVYWRLLWNGPGSFTVGTDTLDQPLLQAWRHAAHLGDAAAQQRLDALATELAQRTPAPRTRLAHADAWLALGRADQVASVLQDWDVSVAGPLPPRALALLAGHGAPEGAVAAGKAGGPTGPDFAAALKLSRAQTQRFLQALGAQFAQDIKKHGTTNLLGATKAAARDGGSGVRVVEAGLGNVPLEVRKALFEGASVQLSGQFLRQLTRELSRRLHQPATRVERTLTRLRDLLEQHINERAPLTIPYVAAFRVKNEPAPSGAPRFYLVVDVAPELLNAAQQAQLYQPHADYGADAALV